MATAKASSSKAPPAKVPPAKIDAALLKAMCQAFADGALPGESEGFGKNACDQAAQFMVTSALVRKPGAPLVALDSFTDEQGRLAMRIAINNDDMPFLVDSVSAAVASYGVPVQRLIHPVLDTERDNSGVLTTISAKRGSIGKRESFIYLETGRVDAKAPYNHSRLENAQHPHGPR